MAGRVYSTKYGASTTAEDTQTRPDYSNRIKLVSGAPTQPQARPSSGGSGGSGGSGNGGS